MSTKFPTSVMVLGVVSSDGDVMPLTSSLRASGWPLTTTSRSWKPWSSSGWLEWPLRGRMSFNKTLHQCIWPIRPGLVVPATTLPWLLDLWPPSSPDLNPLDYYVWGILEKKVNYTKQELKDAIVGDRMEVKACSTFCHCLEAIIEKGDHIE